MSFLPAALEYAARGWCIIPIRHRGRGKEAACRWTRYQRERPADRTLRRWFEVQLDGLAVVFGDVSGGLVCRDFDRLDSYKQWAAAQPELAAALPTVKTARGRHVYFRSQWRGYIDMPDGELRGDSGHYCVLPPSRHLSGTVYRWLVPLPDGPLPELDPFAVGLAPDVTEQAEQTKQTEAIEKGRNDSRLTVESAICLSLPTGPGQRNQCAFRLARALKAVPGLADAEPAALRGIVRQWHQQALPFIRTRPFDESWAEFVYAWSRVVLPWGTDALSVVWRKAMQAECPEAAERYELPEVRRLVAFCRQLQRSVGDGAFFLSCRTAARLLECGPMTAWRWLNMLTADDVLSVVHRGTAGAKGRATRYRYVGDDGVSA